MGNVSTWCISLSKNYIIRMQYFREYINCKIAQMMPFGKFNWCTSILNELFFTRLPLEIDIRVFSLMIKSKLWLIITRWIFILQNSFTRSTAMKNWHKLIFECFLFRFGGSSAKCVSGYEMGAVKVYDY